MADPASRSFRRWCREGDPEALAELFDLTAPRLLKLAIHLVGDAAAAEDLVQATFLAAIEQRERVDAERPVMPWLSAVLTHKAKKHRRANARVLDLDRLATRAEEDASRPLERRELDGEVARALDALAEPYRAVLVLRLRHGMEIADIAHVLERDPGTVRVQLHRGLERLRRTLPASFASLLVADGSAARGLAAVREAVLCRARSSPAFPVSTATLGATLVSKKVILGAVALGALGAWSVLRQAPGVAPTAAVASVGVASGLDATLERSDALGSHPGIADRAPGRVLRPSPVTMLRGRVVDAETGAPIADASVALFPPREALALDLLRDQPELYGSEAGGLLAVRRRGDWPLVEALSERARVGRAPVLAFGRPGASEQANDRARSAVDGTFSLASDPRGGVLEGASPGYATRWRPVRPGDDALEIELWRERDVAGVVVRSDGEPIGEPLELALYETQKSRLSVPAQTAEPGEAAGGVVRYRPSPPAETLGVWTTRTDADGRFRASVGGKGHLLAEVLTPGWRAVKSGTQADGALVVRCEPWATLHVFDAASGAPVESVRVVGRLSSASVHWAGTFFAPGGRLDLPGAPGYGVAHGTKMFGELAIWSDGHRETTVSVPDFAAAATVDVPLHAGAVPVLEGVVLRDGTPVVGAAVALLGRGTTWGVGSDLVVDAASTDGEGAFRLSAPEDAYVLRVRASDEPYLESITFVGFSGWKTRAIPGMEPFLSEVEIPAKERLIVDLAGTARVELEIVDADGAPRLGHKVTLFGEDGRILTAYTDARGAGCFPNLPAGRYRIGTTHKTLTAAYSAAHDEVREVELSAASVVRVRISLPSDAPRRVRFVAGAIADYTGWTACPWGTGETRPLEPDGSLELGLENWIEVHAPDRRRWTLHFASESADRDVIELPLGDHVYRGVLEHADGSPWRNVAVHAVADSPSAKGLSVAAVTDDAGVFEISGLVPADYKILFNTRIDQPPEEPWRNALAGVELAPAAPPSEAGTSLAIRVPDLEPSLLVRGVVERASGVALRDVWLVFACEESTPDGVLRLTNGTSVFADANGSFTAALPRTSRLGVGVYESWTTDGLVLTQHLDPSADLRALRLVVP